ncbi:MAG: glycine--tRNA ligase subunit beta, partial [Terriglobales bacterium]
MPEPLLLEIGCEEMPARFVAGLARQLADKLNNHLKELGLAESPGNAQWTPRRLIYLHPAVREQQPVSEVEVQGPPVRLAIAADGSFTPQAVAFAAKSGAAAADLYRVTTAKGEYVALRRQQGGARAAALLAELIPRVFAALDLPRSMTWDDGDLRFIRPVRWVLALLGSEPLALKLGNLVGGNLSHGHRTLGQTFTVASAGDFPELWKRNFVQPDPAERRGTILSAAVGVGARRDDALLDTLVNLTEWPDIVVGEFSAAFLAALPPEVLVTVMRDHQKYFAVETSDGMLAAKFVAVINQQGDAQGLIRHGNERVLRARFSDAQFFWDQDRKRSLAERLPLLEQVTFQAKLGSYRAKSRRLRALAGLLAGLWPNADGEAAAVAAELAKCDLITEMVKEFPELQGI